MVWQAHILIRSRITGLSEWRALPLDKRARPYLYPTREIAVEDATHYVDTGLAESLTVTGATRQTRADGLPYPLRYVES